MTKKELVAKVAKKAGVPEAEAVKVFNAVFGVFADEVKKGDVRVDGFGTFRVVKRAARKGINPLTKKPVNIPAKNAVVFKPASALKEKVN